MQESENCSHNCRECGSDCAERREPQSFLEEPKAGTHVKRVIGIVSGKGGVGKSLVTSLLASAMQKKGCPIDSISVPSSGWYRCGNFPTGTGWDDCGQGRENGRDVTYSGTWNCREYGIF